jgi:uncharacterized protein
MTKSTAHKTSILKRSGRFFLVLAAVLCGFPAAISAQDTLADPLKYSIKGRGINNDGAIKLRWAPDNAAAWMLLNDYGYKIERYTIKINGVKNPAASKSVLTEALKPAPEMYWEPLKESKYAMILAQAIHGTTFQTDVNTGENMSIVNRIKESQARFSFGLLAADVDFEAACLGALGYADENTSPGHAYLYKIIPLVPDTLLQIDTGFIYADMQNVRQLAPVQHIEAGATEKHAILTWNAEAYSLAYVGYFVERSADGTNYEPVNHEVYIPMKGDKKMDRGFCVFYDSIPMQGKAYHYRIRGVTSFGQLGPFSESISLSSRPMIKSDPAIVSTSLINNGQVKIEWEFPEANLQEIDFYLLAAKRPDAGFSRIGQAGNSTQITVSQEDHARYYKIEAVDQYNYHYYSRPALVQLVDSMPPKPPEGLRGSIDTLGNVSIWWNPNTEPDLEGYKIFFANHASREFSQLAPDILQNNTYSYQTNMKTLTKQVYYKIIALDNHFNASGFSKILKLARPDLVPPSAPVFRVKADSVPVIISWKPSFSGDVALYKVLRKAPGDTVFNTIFEENSRATNYADANIKTGGKHTYKVVAVDSAGNQSKNNKPYVVNISSGRLQSKVPVCEYRLKKDEQKVSFFWENAAEIKKIMVYKKQQDTPFTLYTSLSRAEFEPGYTDKNVQIGMQYSYMFRYINNKGHVSAFSPTISFTY